MQHNLTATVDPEALCIIGGIPRHNASGLPFEILQGANKIAFLYWYSYFRLIPIDAKRKHSDDPDPSFFGEEIGHWEGDTLVIDSIGFKDDKVWIDENANPNSTVREESEHRRTVWRLSTLTREGAEWVVSVPDTGSPAGWGTMA